MTGTESGLRRPPEAGRAARLRAGTALGLLLVLGLCPALVRADTVLPGGGKVTAGTATTSSSGSEMSIEQSSDTAILNWQSFSIGPGAAVHFDNGSGATLNRVRGNVASTIDGGLSATGSLFLVNPAGVVVGPGGTVATGGSFVASTLDVSDEDFLNGGDLRFSGGAGSVANLGTIRSARGDVALIAQKVGNTGTIAAPRGTAALAAGTRVLMRAVDEGRGKFAVEIGGPDSEAVNSGTIQAATAELRANGGNVYALAGNTGGTIRATGAAKSGGRVFLTAGAGHVKVSQPVIAQDALAPTRSARPQARPGGQVTVDGGTVEIAGTVDARGTNGGNGGTISVTGGDIALADGAVLDASGAAGGTIYAFADGTMDVSGRLTATGADAAGGFIETSGKYLNIGAATVDAGTGGHWLLDPVDLTVDAAAAAVINGSLGGGNDVTLQTTATGASGPGTQTSGAGDITIDSALSWGSAATLTLDAYHGINILAPITVSGAGGVVLTTNNGGSGGDYSFGLTAGGFRGSLNYGSTDNGGSLNIDGTDYTLVYDMAGLQDVNSDLTGAYALAGSLDASAVTGWVPLGTDGAGTVLNGNQGFTGSFTGLGHVISDLAVDAGANSYAGLFGWSQGTVRDIGTVGGTVAAQSHAGGLIGRARGTVTNAYATGAVTTIGHYAGGLIGSNASGTISNAFATGTVTAGGGHAGGLIGRDDGGTISSAFATGTVTAGGSAVGGLIGFTTQGIINNVYATGAVISNGTYGVGGLIGHSLESRFIGQAYATGVVIGGSGTGGLIGSSVASAILDAYWDTDTSGIATGFFGTGMTTAQMTTSLPGGFDSSVWGGGGGLYPYLKRFFPDGVQAVSGTVYQDAGTTVAASGALGAVTVSLDAGGSLLGRATTGANGYYYIALPAKTVASGDTLLASVPTAAATGATDAARLAAATATGADQVQAGVDLYGDFLAAATDATTLSGAPDLASLQASANTVAGSDSGATAVIGRLARPGYLSSGGGFTIDESTSGDGLLVSIGTGDAITVSEDMNIADGGALALLSGGALNIDAPIALAGAGDVTLAYDSSDPTNLGFGLSWRGFAGGIDYGSTDNGGTLTVNGAPYTLLYDMAAVSNIRTDLGGNYALATSLDASATAGWDGVGDFAGTLTGLGNTVSDLAVAGGVARAGLFQTNHGTMRDIGVVGGAMSGSTSAGLVGASDGTIVDAYSTATVTSTGNTAGGLVAFNAGTILRSFATGQVAGTAFVAGGLVGDNSGTIDHSFATGSVSGMSFAGGLVGQSSGSISNSYAIGAVNGNSTVGGLVGLSSGTLSNVYALGTVSGTTAGGLLGASSGTGTITNGYWDTDVTPTGIAEHQAGNTATATGLTTAELAAGLPTGFDASIWGNAGNTVTPYLLYPEGPFFVASDSSNAFFGIRTLEQLQAMNDDLSRNYALLSDIDASATAGWNGGAGFAPLGSEATPYAGVFDGLDHAIGGLTIDRTSTDNVGLFGYTRGATLRNIGLEDSSIRGGGSVGGLIGHQVTGTVSRSYVDGSVSGGSAGAGGLVGFQTAGSISQSYATAAVSGAKGVGGLVGIFNGNSISQSYAAGPVSGASSVGGLVGQQGSGTVSQSYATGAVSGSYFFGGLVGNQILGAGTVTASYWDKDTTGQATSDGSAPADGLSTAALQGALPGGFDSAVWGTGSGLYPYFKWRYPTTPLAITGTAYSDSGATPLASGASGAVRVSALADGTALGTADTGANGYYYLLLPGDTLTGSQQLLSYLDGNAVKANSYVADASGNTRADLFGGWQRISSADTTVSAMFAGLGTALGSHTGSDFLYSGGAITSGTDLDIVSSGAGGLAVDTALDVGGETIRLTAAGAVTQSAALTAAGLELLGPAASYALDDSANAIGTVAAETGAVTLASSGDLSIGTVNDTVGMTSSGAVILTAAGDLSIGSGAQVSAGGGDAVLAAGGSFFNDAGASTVSASGRWLIYSAAPGGNSFGGLDSGHTAIWNATYSTLAPGSVAATGNRYLFAKQPTLTFTTTNESKIYGEDAGSAVAAAYGISGFESGVAGAFLGDDAASVFSGAPDMASAGAGVEAAVGSYAITATTGTLSALNGYSFAIINDGTLDVNRRALTVTAEDLSRVYGDGNPALSYGISSGDLVNGDTLSGALATSADGRSDVGSYAITQGTLAATSNYALRFVGGTLDVTQRALTVMAEDLVLLFGEPVTGLSAQVTGGSLAPFHDTLAVALEGYAVTVPATQGSPVGTYKVTAEGRNANYALRFRTGTLTIAEDTARPFLGVQDPDWAERGDDGSGPGGEGEGTDEGVSSQRHCAVVDVSATCLQRPYPGNRHYGQWLSASAQ